MACRSIRRQTWAWLTRALGVLLGLLFWSSAALALDVPPLKGHVNDIADLLSPAAEQALEQKLSAYEQRSQHQLALLTVESLEGDSVEDFSIRVVEAWKLGKKGKDDGLLLLVVERERKLRIEVGYGLEGDITDAVSARVIRNVLSPAFREGAPERGIEQAFDALIKKASGEAVGVVDSPAPSRAAKRPSLLGVLALLLLALPFLLPLFLGRGGRSRRSGMLLGGLAGLGYGGGWGGSGRGGWGGGFGGGGGGGGGGFSGGGGGFGGGGASGSW